MAAPVPFLLALGAIAVAVAGAGRLTVGIIAAIAVLLQMVLDGLAERA